MRRIGVLAVVCLLAALAFSQVNFTPMPVPKMQFADMNGVPLAGGFVWTYAAGTTTPQASYTDYTGATMNANPVVLDSAGRAAIFLGNLSYKFVVQNSASVQQWMVDGVASVGAVFAAPPAIGTLTPGAITGTIMLATTDFNCTGTVPCYQINGVALNFSNLAGWPAAGIPNSTGLAWGASYPLSGSGSVCMTTGCVMTTPNIGAATGTSVTLSGQMQSQTANVTGASTTNGIANNDAGITQSGTLTPKNAASATVGTSTLPYAAVSVGPSASANATISCPTCTTLNSVTVPNVPGQVLLETLNAATLTPGTNVTSTVCATAACNSVRGTVTIVGGTATTGTIATLSWTAVPTAYVCTATQNGGATSYGIGNSVATTTGFNITSAVTVSGQTLSVNYSCQP